MFDHFIFSVNAVMIIQHLLWLQAPLSSYKKDNKMGVVY